MSKNVTTEKLSRYTQGGTTVLSGNKVKWWEPFVIAESNDDLYIEIVARFNKRPDKLAYELYKKPELSWLILQYNKIVDINEEFVTGKFITVPNPNRVIFDILNKQFKTLEY